jgi:hypothetical protein
MTDDRKTLPAEAEISLSPASRTATDPGAADEPRADAPASVEPSASGEKAASGEDAALPDSGTAEALVPTESPVPTGPGGLDHPSDSGDPADPGDAGDPDRSADPDAVRTAVAAGEADEAGGADAPAPPRRSSGRGTVLLRWGTAMLVAVLAGTGAGFAMTAPDRTGLPGLRTPSDGRYTFPGLLQVPTIRAGTPSVSPSSEPSEGSTLRLRNLTAFLPPLPDGATQVPADGSCAAYSKIAKDPGLLRPVLKEDACRSGAARAWTAADGTRTEIRLLGFGSSEESNAFFISMTSAAELKALPSPSLAPEPSLPIPSGVLTSFAAQAGRAGASGPQVARVAHLSGGGVFATVLMTNSNGVPEVPFRQVVLYQTALIR